MPQLFWVQRKITRQLEASTSAQELRWYVVKAAPTGDLR
jgi:hypothetical protein